MEITYKFDHEAPFIFFYYCSSSFLIFTKKTAHGDTFQWYLMFHLSIKFDKTCTKIII